MNQVMAVLAGFGQVLARYMSDNPTSQDFGQAATSPERTHDRNNLRIVRDPEVDSYFITFGSLIQ